MGEGSGLQGSMSLKREMILRSRLDHGRRRMSALTMKTLSFSSLLVGLHLVSYLFVSAPTCILT